MANEKRLIEANALCEFFQERYEYLRNASETQLPNVNVQVDLDIQVGAIIAKEFLDKAKQAKTVDAVEVVHGYWIDGYNVDHIGRIIEHSIDCSVCDSVFKDDSREVVKHWKERFKVCPFCGAKMDGDGNG